MPAAERACAGRGLHAHGGAHRRRGVAALAGRPRPSEHRVVDRRLLRRRDGAAEPARHAHAPAALREPAAALLRAHLVPRAAVQHRVLVQPALPDQEHLHQHDPRPLRALRDPRLLHAAHGVQRLARRARRQAHPPQGPLRQHLHVALRHRAAAPARQLRATRPRRLVLVPLLAQRRDLHLAHADGRLPVRAHQGHHDGGLFHREPHGHARRIRR